MSRLFLSICLLRVFDYTPTLHRLSAQGISQEASGAAALGGREKGARKWDT